MLVGGDRQLAFFPELPGERVVLAAGVAAVLDRVAELAEDRNVCILASGDPLFFGIGRLVLGKLGAAHVEVIPQPSSVQLAFARAGLAWDDAAFVSLHGRPLEGFVDADPAPRQGRGADRRGALAGADRRADARVRRDRLARLGLRGPRRTR